MPEEKFAGCGALDNRSSPGTLVWPIGMGRRPFQAERGRSLAVRRQGGQRT
jgi:hypothetical protein